jgi:hypothetical protein
MTVGINRRVLLLACAVVASLAFGASSASAATFQAGIYRSDSATCSGGATSTGGARYGIFKVTATHGSQVVDASVTVNHLHPFTNYNISIVESGYACIAVLGVASLSTDAFGKGVVHFQFWQHTNENQGWAYIQHGNSNDIVLSTAVPIQG